MIWLLLGCAAEEPTAKTETVESPEALEEEIWLSEDMLKKEKAASPSPSAAAAESAEEPVHSEALLQMLATGGNSQGLGGVNSAFGADEVDLAAALEGIEGTAKDAPKTTLRSWFPETFIFEPLIETNADGHASYSLIVPDRLTTWRILGLAHNSTGQTAGSVHEFLGTLPQYVDPAFPPFMRLGDKLELPILSTNTAQDKVQSRLNINVQGGQISKDNIAIQIPPLGSVRSTTTLEATETGEMDITIDLKGIDAIKNQIPVYPLGQMQISTERGILNAEQAFQWSPPENALPNSTRLQLSIYPGALGFFRSELRRSAGEDFNANVYRIVIAHQMKSLMEKMGIDESFDKLNRQLEQAAQQLYFNLENNRVEDKINVVEAFLAIEDNLVMHRTGISMANQIADAQRADGTIGSASTVQQHLVNMAWVAMIFQSVAEIEPELKPRSDRVIQLINQGIPRLWAQHKDGYTAAWLYATGLGSEAQRTEWQQFVRESLTEKDGQWSLAIPEGVQSLQGLPPNQSEYHALASVVLQSDLDISASLLGEVMTSYRPQNGWGQAQRNQIIFYCLTQSVQQAIPDEVTLEILDQETRLSTTTVQKSELQDLVYIDIPLDSNEASKWRIKVSPPVPSMSFSANFSHYEPIKDNSEKDGLGFSMTRPSKLKVNQATELPITIALPKRTHFTLQLSLPVGIKITAEAQKELENQSFTLVQNDEELSISGRSGDQTITTLNLMIEAQFKGKLSGGAHTLHTDTTTRTLAPQQWTIQ